jgi:mono/diheme cytochrome c family protein
MTRRLLLVSIVPLAALGAGSFGAVRQTTAVEPTTTAKGVYTEAQATRGEETYMNMCVGCHAAGTYSTPVFREKWDRHPLADLYTLISETMPKQDPASLTPQEYAQLVAYLLKINDVPAGKTELSSELDVLKKIEIEMPGVARKQ